MDGKVAGSTSVETKMERETWIPARGSRLQMTKLLTRLSWIVTCLMYAAFISVSGSFAQSPSPLIQNVANRKTISLNGDWHYIVDSQEIGMSRRFYLNGKIFGRRDFVEYDVNTSP